MGHNIRKLFVVLIILLPVVSYTGCKKQSKCGCDGDVLFSVTKELFDHSSIVYSTNGATAYFLIYNSAYYDTYYFCNPSAMYSTYQSMGTKDQVELSGDVYWDCSYVSNASSSSSSSSYYSYYKVYNINVTELASSLYGKK
jgi:hypothetical protein